jgi:hypothetical protein
MDLGRGWGGVGDIGIKMEIKKSERVHSSLGKTVSYYLTTYA